MTKLEASILLINGGRLRKKDWEEGKFIMFDKGKLVPKTKDSLPFYTDRGYCCSTQYRKFYSTLDELLSSEGIENLDDFEEIK